MTDLTEIITNWRKNGTPGPWRLVPASEMGDRCTIHFDEVWSDGTEILVASEVTRAHCDGGRASLRLIAAAPDMADRIEALEAENARLRETMQKVAGGPLWNDRDDALTLAVENDFGSEGFYKRYGRALELVSNRHSKGALVRLVAYLLAQPRRLETLLEEIRDLTVEHRDHATMDEAEAVMRWTLWEAVLDDIKEVLGEQE
jgi:hypothetical protein